MFAPNIPASKDDDDDDDGNALEAGVREKTY